jgi:hypothetical protein
MEEMEPLVNRVANSGLITINLEHYYPAEAFEIFDLKDFLFKGLILREKEFRQALKEHNWQEYAGKIILVQCSADAIIPVWAYMIIATYAAPLANEIFMGTQQEFLKYHFKSVANSLNLEEYKGKRIVIKGCSDKPVPPDAYLEITKLLQPYAQSIMFGEPCSTVPVFKRPRELKKSVST